MKKILFSFLGFFLVNIAKAEETYLWIDSEKLRKWDITINDIPKIINSLTSFLLWLSAMISMVMIIVWAYKMAIWSLSADNKKWKETIQMWLTGLVVSLSAWFIINVIISNL